MDGGGSYILLLGDVIGVPAFGNTVEYKYRHEKETVEQKGHVETLHNRSILDVPPRCWIYIPLLPVPRPRLS